MEINFAALDWREWQTNAWEAQARYIEKLKTTKPGDLYPAFKFLMWRAKADNFAMELLSKECDPIWIIDGPLGGGMFVITGANWPFGMGLGQPVSITFQLTGPPALNGLMLPDRTRGNGSP